MRFSIKSYFDWLKTADFLWPLRSPIKYKFIYTWDFYSHGNKDKMNPTYTYIHTYIHTYIYIYIYIYMILTRQKYLNEHNKTCKYIHKHTHTFIFIYLLASKPTIYWNAWHQISYLFLLRVKLVMFYLQVCISRDRWRIIRKCIAACLWVFFKRWVARWRWWRMIGGRKGSNS